MAAGTQTMLSYSRDDEREADQLGFKKAYLAGFKPDAFISALAKLQQGQWGANQTPAYLLTHPVDSERMSNLEVMSRQYADTDAMTEQVERFRKLYPLFRTIVKAQSTGPGMPRDILFPSWKSRLIRTLRILGLESPCRKKGNMPGP